MLSLLAFFALSAPAPSFGLSADAPAGTDLLLRIETGKVWATGAAMLDELAPLVGLFPGGRPVATKLGDKLQEQRTLLASQTGLDLSRKDAVLTVAVDLDAVGGTVWAAIARAARNPKAAASAADDNVDAFAIDGEAAARLKSFDLAWLVRTDGSVLLGSERGLQRQLRALTTPALDAKSTLVTLARRLRKPGAVSAVFVLPRPLRLGAAKAMATIGPLVRELKGLSLTTTASTVELTLLAETDRGHEALERGARALVALLRASSALVEAGAQAVLGLDRLSKWPAVVPKEIDAGAIKELSTKWVEGFTLAASFRKRPDREVEVSLKPSSARGLVAATALLAGYLVPRPTSGAEQEARLILMTLRQLELAHRKHKGTFVACGPVPAETPTGAVDWPDDSCFAPLGFKPPGKVHFQILVTAEGGNLLLLARGDPDGDGVPETWALDETAPSIRRLREDGPDDDEPAADDDSTADAPPAAPPGDAPGEPDDSDDDFPDE